jgi:hypothetical protein
MLPVPADAALTSNALRCFNKSAIVSQMKYFVQ